MKIFDSQLAYEKTCLFRKNLKEQVMDSYAEAFNKMIELSINQGSELCTFSFEAVGIFGNPKATDIENLANFVELLIDSNYEVQYYYHNPYCYDISGIVVAWGPEAAANIDNFFSTTMGNFYRGDENEFH